MLKADSRADKKRGEAQIEEHLQKAPEIVFDHVSFRYDGAEEDTLHDISFTIKSGEHAPGRTWSKVGFFAGRDLYKTG